MKRFRIYRLLELAALAAALAFALPTAARLWQYAVDRAAVEALRQQYAAVAKENETGVVLPGQRAVDGAAAGDASARSPSLPTAKGNDAFPLLQIDFAALCAACPGTVGWVQFEALDISCPVLQAADNEYYLTHAPDGRKSSGGSLFLDAACSSDFLDAESIVYGHNMKDGSMLGSLRAYRDAAFYAQNGGALRLYTPDGAVHRYEIFAVHMLASDASLYALGPQAGALSPVRIDTLTQNALYITGLAPAVGDRVLMFSTCTGRAGGTQRLAVCAVETENAG